MEHGWAPIVSEWWIGEYLVELANLESENFPSQVVNNRDKGCMAQGVLLPNMPYG